MVKKTIIILFFLFFLPSLFFTNKSFAGCGRFSGQLAPYDGSGLDHVLCGRDKNGNTNIGVCYFSDIGCQASVMPGMEDVNNVSGATVGNACNDHVPGVSGVSWLCETPLNSSGQFCVSPEDKGNNRLVTLSSGNLSYNGYCSNNQECYINPNDNSRNCSGTAIANPVCLHPGVTGDGWNVHVNADGSLGWESDSGYACYNDCNGVYTNNPSKACPNGSQGGQGGVNNNISPIITLTPYPLPCAGGGPVKGTCSSFDSAVGNINTSDTASFVGQFLAILLGLSGGVSVLIIIFSGYELAMSQGNPEKIKGARERLTAAIVGLLFIIFSTTILQIIGVEILKLPGFIQFTSH